MAIIRIHENECREKEVMTALREFFDYMEEIDRDKYRQTRDFRVIGELVPEEDKFIQVKIYYPDGIKPFVIEVE